MKKLLVLLLIPFVVGLLGHITDAANRTHLKNSKELKNAIVAI